MFCTTEHKSMIAITTNYENAKKAAAFIAQLLMLTAMLDAAILILSLAQIASGDKIGYWSPFWQSQARLVIDLLR